jgi:hypothetical protein
MLDADIHLGAIQGIHDANLGRGIGDTNCHISVEVNAEVTSYVLPW